MGNTTVTDARLGNLQPRLEQRSKIMDEVVWRMRKKALVTGISGFAASHLAELLLIEGWEVHGTLRARSNTENIAAILPMITTHVCDITDAYSVKEVMQKVEPNVVFHLAAQSFVPLSWK